MVLATDCLPLMTGRMSRISMILVIVKMSLVLFSVIFA